MLRRVFLSLCYSVPQLSRVGIFPLHLDPPTAQHREIFRLLIGDTTPDRCNAGRDGGGGGGPRYGNGPGQLVGSLCCLESLAESLKKSECVPFEHLILVPNTRFPITLRLSTHLAAMTTLVARGLPRVHVDFTALENPDEDMPCVYELTQRYSNSTLVHWLQDAHEMQRWAHFSDVRLHVPLLLLQTVSFSVSMLGKPRDARFEKKYASSVFGALGAPEGAAAARQPPLQGRPPQEKTSDDAASPAKADDNARDSHDDTAGGAGDCGGQGRTSPRWVHGGNGDEEVEMSRSYLSSSGSSWLASSHNVPLLLQPSDLTDRVTGGGRSPGARELESTLQSKGEAGGRAGGAPGDAGKTVRGASGEATAATQADGAADASGGPPSTREANECGYEDMVDEFESLSLSSDAMPTRLKVRHLVEELFSTHHGMECAPSRPATATAASPHVEVHTVHRCTGADVRQALWEREVDPALLLTEPVHRYITSHGLYHDYRKGNYPNMAQVQQFSSGSSRSSSSSAWRRGKVQSIGPSATLSFPGLIPRLELHYEASNLLACEYYDKLKSFESPVDEEPDLIVPIGGDGYMMHCIRNNWDRFIPFFGVNAGHVGYLLNDPATLGELFSAPLKLHSTIMLYCLAEKDTESGEKVLLSHLAFNDAWVERSSGQTAHIRILVNGEERIHLRGDGVLVSTAAGSTAYCQALGASPVPVGAPLIQVVGSNVVSPAQWRPTHLNQEDQVELEVTDSFKRPCRCFVDSVDVGNVTRMLVRSSRAAGVAIAFTSSCDLQQKLYQMQFPKSR
ncbi:putative inorganic polyphosphate/ATP-NAD kinase, putative,poly(p)/ATP NAD kinase [Trypanosoma conorhini]|uniref:Putative inorganic polyphosphate/ATP-NAD kinase, putative,poly(P)/ATP NAD kinase n=1 Tax=Trypanosoma conorhini TaxID=83891 RepID=A0A3R7L4G9_9TRYP|nr:putative inorganic polyphosphate/ATP-NAD kinase, putative,poly(p)/ATP NAD kinase [Trypanosoma conorhini]RNF16039.1 putative inorganic polyphosphate/ATP-NAD kinase, putative,poly(p)/ATP NAD kinase [Trypanosoma conorhini]